MSIHQKKNGTWFVQYRVPGERIPRREYCGVGPDGEQRARLRDAEIKEIKARGERPQGKVYLDYLAQAYLSDRKLHGASEGWLTRMETLFNKTVLPVLCRYPVDEINYTDIISLMERAFPHAKMATKQRYLGYLKATFSFGVEHELTKRNPLAKWKKQAEPKYPMLLTLADLEKLLQHAAPHLEWAIRVEWELGARPGPSELFAVCWEHVDFERCLVHIPGTKTPESDRVIPISREFCKVLKERQKNVPSTYIIEYRGKPLKKMKTALAGAQRRAKLPYRIRMYDIRHLFATTMLVGKADMAAVSRLLGHSSISTTQEWYYHVLPGEMQRAIKRKPKLKV